MPETSTHPTSQVSVIDLLARRRDDLEAGRPFTDGCKLGLAVEGGGMRGVVSGAMLIAIEDLGLKSVFDGCYGTSSGSLNLAYFLAGWRWAALTMYYDHLALRGFIDILRPVRKRSPIVDMGLLFDVVMNTDLPLDYSSVRVATPRLHIGVSAIDDVEAQTICHFRSSEVVR